MTASRTVWARPRPGPQELRVDLVLALVLALGTTTTSLLYDRVGILEDPAPTWVWALGLGLSTLPLALRRMAPIPVAIVVAIGFFVCGQFGVPELLIINITLFLSLYTVGAWERNRVAAVWTIVAVSVGLLVWLLISLIIASSAEDEFMGAPRAGLFSAYATFAVIQIITNLLYFAGAYWFGLRAWRAARTQAQLEAQGAELELERQTSAAQAVALDRVMIARELHDVVAHHVSVMGIQAAAARRIMDRDPDRAAAALKIVEESAHTAIEELRGLVHTLRTPEAEEGTTTVGIAQLPRLVAESQSAGVPTTLIVAGEARPVPMLVDVALYRVAQEALTNVRKHAGRGAEATVRLRFSADAVELEVSDNGVAQRLASARVGGVGRLNGEATGGPGSRGSGLGLRGMRERIGAVGGSISAGQRERGGFIVRARVPLAGALDEGASPLRIGEAGTALSGAGSASRSDAGAANSIEETPEPSPRTHSVPRGPAPQNPISSEVST